MHDPKLFRSIAEFGRPCRIITPIVVDKSRIVKRHATLVCSGGIPLDLLAGRKFHLHIVALVQVGAFHLHLHLMIVRVWNRCVLIELSADRTLELDQLTPAGICAILRKIDTVGRRTQEWILRMYHTRRIHHLTTSVHLAVQVFRHGLKLSAPRTSSIGASVGRLCTLNLFQDDLATCGGCRSLEGLCHLGCSHHFTAFQMPLGCPLVVDTIFFEQSMNDPAPCPHLTQIRITQNLLHIGIIGLERLLHHDAQPLDLSAEVLGIQGKVEDLHCLLYISDVSESDFAIKSPESAYSRLC